VQASKDNTKFVNIDMCPPVDWDANLITLAVIVCGNIVFHIFFVIISNLKSKYYFQSDSKQKEK